MHYGFHMLSLKFGMKYKKMAEFKNPRNSSFLDVCICLLQSKYYWCLRWTASASDLCGTFCSTVMNVKDANSHLKTVLGL